MLILLLLLSGGACDWVEISQNHYRKEPTRKLVNFDHTTKSNRIYRNNSVTEKLWHRGAVNKLSNVANVRRVQYPSVKTDSLKTRHEDNRFDNKFNDHADTTEAKYNFMSIKPDIQKFDEDDEVFENQSKVINNPTTIISIDHIQPPNLKPIKKPPATVVNYFDRRKIISEKENIRENSFHNKIKHIDVIKPSAETNNEKNFNDDEASYTLQKPNIHRISHNDKVKLVSTIDSENRDPNNTVAKQIPKVNLTEREYNENFKENDVYKKQSITNTEYSDKAKYKPHDISSHPLEEYFNQFEKLSGHNIDRNNFNIKNADGMLVDEANSHIPVTKVEIAQIKDDKETASPESENSKLNVTNGSPVKGMWKLMKVVADTIYRNTHRSFKSKITYLENLKSTVLTSIKDQIDSAWPDDAHAPSRRPTRAAHARGHVEFPSSESTLMTISFLTFAVFLIKLVLQIIHTYKNKAMMMTPAVVAAVGRAAAAFRTPK